MRLEARHLDFGYRGKRVGSGVSLGVESGEVLCLLGPNGSGKTTLFKTLLGLLPSQGGGVLMDGVDLAALRRDGDEKTPRCAVRPISTTSRTVNGKNAACACGT